MEEVTTTVFLTFEDQFLQNFQSDLDLASDFEAKYPFWTFTATSIPSPPLPSPPLPSPPLPSLPLPSPPSRSLTPPAQKKAQREILRLATKRRNKSNKELNSKEIEPERHCCNVLHDYNLRTPREKNH